MIATAYSFKCLSYDEIANKTLYHAIVEYYFPQELRHQNTPMSEYLSSIPLHTQLVVDARPHAKIMDFAALMPFTITI